MNDKNAFIPAFYKQRDVESCLLNLTLRLSCRELESLYSPMFHISHDNDIYVNSISHCRDHKHVP